MKHQKKRPEGQQLKRLQTQRRQLRETRGVLTNRRADLCKEISSVDGELERVTGQIISLQGKGHEPKISEHALLRFLERVKGIDMEQLKAEILTTDIVHQAQNLGNGKFPSGTGFRAVVQNNTIVTIEV